MPGLDNLNHLSNPVAGTESRFSVGCLGNGLRTLAHRRVRSLGGVRERRRGLAADNRGGLVNQFVVV